MKAASPVTAISPPSCGTRRALRNRTASADHIQFPPPKADLAVNRWIIGEVVDCLEKLNKAFAEFRFDGMADAIYHFVWDQFCDWYLELIKPAFVDGEKQDMDAESKLVAGWVLDQILVMLHPFMPFITEELWHSMGEREYDIIHAKWPDPRTGVDSEAASETAWVQALISQIRTTKSDLGVAPGKTVNAFISRADQKQFDWLNTNLMVVKRMGRLDTIQVRTPGGFKELGLTIDDIDISSEIVAEVEGEGHVQLVADGIIGHLDFFGIIDLDAERTRITKAMEAASKERDALAGRLSNAAFVEKAKPEAVEKARADHAEKSEEAERLTAALARLG